MLNAEHWLFAAAETANNSKRDLNSLGAIRELVAKHLERLQPEAYKALARRNVRKAHAKANWRPVADEPR
jgi:hypothetical protein